MSEYRFFENFLYRVPHFSNNRYRDPNQFLYNSQFEEAIYLASRPLYKSVFNDHKTSLDEFSAKQKNSIIKYIYRMCIRCTPFGNFASSGIGTSGGLASANLTYVNDLFSVTSIDLEFYILLCREIEKTRCLNEVIIYYPNTSIYRLNNTVRYIERKHTKKGGEFLLSQLDNSKALGKVLTACGAGAVKFTLINLLIDYKFSDNFEDACEYIQDLIDNQVIISELWPGATKNNLTTFDIFFEKYRDLIPDNLSYYFDSVRHRLITLNLEKAGFKTKLINELEGIIHKHNEVSLDQGKNFTKTNLYSHSNGVTVGAEMLTLVKDGLRILNILTQKNFNSKLENFKNRFYERYENEKIPLTEALDPDIGIGFETITSENISHHHLTKGISVRNKYSKKKNIHNGLKSINAFILNKYVDFLDNKAKGINLYPADFDKAEESWDDLPLTFAIGTEILRAGVSTEPLILLKFAGGYSSNAILGRFSSDSEQIRRLTEQIRDYESDKIGNNAVLAELNFVPEDLNHAKVLTRELIYDYEIPIMSSPGPEKEHQILLSDLYLSITSNNQLIITSKRLNKQVIPRNSTADSFELSSNPFYYFLSVMQGNGEVRGGLNLSWGDFRPLNNFYPRITYDNKIILSLARWEVSYSKLNKNGNFVQNFEKLRKELDIPDRFNIVSGYDNKLLIDMNNEFSLEILINEMKKGSNILEEYLYDDVDPFISSGSEIFNNEVVFSLFKS